VKYGGHAVSFDIPLTGNGFRDEVLQLIAYRFPLIGVRQRCLPADDHGPLLRQRRIQFDEGPLLIANVFHGHDSIRRALWNTDSAIDTLVGIDDKKIGPFVETIGRAYFDAIRVTTPDAAFSHDISH
jgi:hypothetical protein